MQANEKEPCGRLWGYLDGVIALGIFAGSLAIYNATLAPSLSYKSADGNELITEAYQLGLAHMTGYPLYTWLGKLFTFIPLGDVAHRVNLMSATLGAAGAAILYLAVLTLTGNRVASLFTAFFFAFSLTFWSQTGIAEVYVPNAFMVALMLLLLFKWAEAEKRPGSRASLWYFLAFSLVFGLSLGTHMSNLGFAPAFALFVLLVNWRVVKQPKLLGGGFLFLVGCLQFLWLPYKASNLTDALMVRNAPHTWEGFYNYTLGAFPQMKFAFPFWALPDRLVIYLNLLRQNFGLIGMVLGLWGMWEMLFRRTRAFYLLIVMYIVHLIFFTQYRVFDLDVFFIPSHLIYAVFIGYGVYRLLEYLYTMTKRMEIPRWAVSGVVALLLLPLVVSQVHANYSKNDYSKDTAINDFYENVFEILPEGSVLLGRSGVFGYDMFYFRLVYDLRPDVLIPQASGQSSIEPEVIGEAIYTTVRMDGGQGFRGPQAPPAGLLSPDAWYIPVLVGQSGQAIPSGQRRELVLCRVSDEPPELAAEGEPQHLIEERVGDLELVGYDLEEVRVGRGKRLSLTYYWRVTRPMLVATFLGDEIVEVHSLGFGNLERYGQELNPFGDLILKEEFMLVVPSWLSPGEWPLKVGSIAFGGGEPLERVIELTVIEVTE